MVKKKMIAFVCAFAMGLSCMGAMPQEVLSNENSITSSAYEQSYEQLPFELPIDRIGGDDRYLTAVEVSKRAYPDGAESVLLANGLDYADALCGSPLANSLQAPILLTLKSELPEATLKEIERLGAKNVYIIGGEGVVDKDIYDELEAKELTVERVWGDNRFGTSVDVAEHMQENRKDKKPSQTAFFVCANDFPDALSASSVASIMDSPIFFVNKTGVLEESVKAYLEKCGKMSTAYVIGGDKAIYDTIGEELKPYFNEWIRYGGSNRYDTNKEVNEKLKSAFTGKDIYLATGKDFPDALTGAVLAAKNRSRIVIADERLTDGQQEYFKNNSIILTDNYEEQKEQDMIYMLGGDGVVKDNTARSLLLFGKPTLTLVDAGTRARLKWTVNRYITSYEIYRDSELIATVTDPYKTVYTDTDLFEESSYDYCVVYNYKIGDEEFESEAYAFLDRKVYDFRDLLYKENSDLLNSVKSNTSKYVFVTENAQGASSTFSSYDMRYLTTGDLKTLEKFAKEHFTAKMTKAEKVAYTVNWINKNVLYATIQNGGWGRLTSSYVNNIFNLKIGQCNSYNGALASMLLYLGYDAHLVMGYRGRADANGKITSKWQHFWCEVKINGKTYVMETGNYGEDGNWMHVCEPYEYAGGYIKNGKMAK